MGREDYVSGKIVVGGVVDFVRHRSQIGKGCGEMCFTGALVDLKFYYQMLRGDI